MSDKIEQGDKVVYTPSGQSVAQPREKIAQKDGEDFGTLAGTYQSTTVRDKETVKEVKDVTSWKK
jgi:hypothetical protein